MPVKVIQIEHYGIEKAFGLCKDVVISGGTVVYPTETFYAIGADPRNRAAVKRVLEIKQRGKGKPILLLIPDARHVNEWAAEVTEEARRLIQIFWPGPLTIVFKAKGGVLPELTAGTGNIGLRVSGSEAARSLVSYLGIPLTGTSANISGGGGLVTAAEAAEVLAGRVDLILDGGRTPGGPASTVIDTSSGLPRLIREGAVSVGEVKKILPEIVIASEG